MMRMPSNPYITPSIARRLQDAKNHHPAYIKPEIPVETEKTRYRSAAGKQ